MDELRKELEAAFIAPYAAHRWLSHRTRSHWVELEGWQDSLAGPLSSIAKTGGCEYVYERDDFVGVTDPTSLRLRLLEWHSGLVAGVETFVPATPAEVEDLEYMRIVSARMRALTERSCEIEKVRFAESAASRNKASTIDDSGFGVIA